MVKRRSELVPIRIDVDYDKSIRIVDTLLLDAYLLPLPHGTSEENVQFLTNNVLADAEVVGVNRTSRNYTGRLDLWRDKLQQMIADQIRPQLEAVVSGEVIQQKYRYTNARKERILLANQAFNTNIENTSNIANNSANSANNKRDHIASNDSLNFAGLIPIHIRLSIRDIRVHDDFYWDPDSDLSPLQVAERIGHDLNLPDDAVQALAIDISEQVYGLKVPNHPAIEDNDNGPQERSNMTGAWTMDPKAHVLHIAFLTEQQQQQDQQLIK